MKKYLFSTLMISALAGVALAEGGAELRELELPAQLPSLIDWFASTKAWDVTKYALFIQAATQLVKMLAAWLATKLPPKYTYGVFSLVTLATAWERAIEDGVINGSDWSSLATTAVSAALAFFSYKVLWSSKVTGDKV